MKSSHQSDEEEKALAVPAMAEGCGQQSELSSQERTQQGCTGSRAMVPVQIM